MVKTTDPRRGSWIEDDATDILGSIELLDIPSGNSKVPGATHLKQSIEGLIPFLVETPPSGPEEGSQFHGHMMNPALLLATENRAVDDTNNRNLSITMGAEFHDIAGGFPAPRGCAGLI